MASKKSPTGTARSLPPVAAAPVVGQFNRTATMLPAGAANTNQLFKVPKPRGESHMDLADLVGTAEVTAIRAAGSIQFQATGDTGVGMNSHQPEVAEAMSRDINLDNPALGPVFFLNLGDVIYGNGKEGRYSNAFYRPNMPYLHPATGFDGVILAIPGNHDGEERDPADHPSLSAFIENFCAPPGKTPPLAASFDVKMPHQPGVYWHLGAPFLDLIGLYSNAAEDFGTLGVDAQDLQQRNWLKKRLQTIAQTRNAHNRKALILATHHPSYSRGLQNTGFGHSGSADMQGQIDEACAAAGIWPDAVLAGHSHNYQRYKRQCVTTSGRSFDTAYFVVGTGGINFQAAPTNVGTFAAETPAPPGLSTSKVIYSNGLKSYGYVRVSASAQILQITFVQTDGNHRNDFETVTIDLATQKQLAP